MTIDSHQHFWVYDPGKHTWMDSRMESLRRNFLPSDLVPELEKNGIDGTVAVQASQSDEETIFLTEAASQNSFIRGVVGWTDLQSDSLPEKLDHYRGYEIIKGFRHVLHDEPDDDYMLRPGFLRGVKILRVYNYTYDILIYARHLENTVRFIDELPGVSLVIDHIGKPGIMKNEVREWETHMRQIASFPDVMCKLSGMVTEAKWNKWSYKEFVPYLDILFDCFGPERLMYGSDWPVCLLSASYDDVAGIIKRYIMKLDPKDMEKVMGGNAVKFYKLEIS